MSEQPEMDPKKLQKQKPDYVEDQSGIDEVDRLPVVGTDPEAGAQEGVHKTIVAPDPEKVRAHERDTDRDADRG